MPKAAVIHEMGGPEVFRYEDVEVGRPGTGEVRLAHIAIGVNYADTYHRGGVSHPWPVGEPPVIVGFEATGEVLELGPGVEDFRVGDRVVYGLPPLGAYCEERLYPVSTLLKIPEGIDATALAGIFMKGVTAYYLLHKTYAVKPGDWVLVHAAAGGMGNVLVPWAKHLGAAVVGTVGSEAKAETAWELGCDHVVNYATEDFAARCRELTDGEGADFTFEAVGVPQLMLEANAAARRGGTVTIVGGATAGMHRRAVATGLCASITSCSHSALSLSMAVRAPASMTKTAQ